MSRGSRSHDLTDVRPSGGSVRPAPGPHSRGSGRLARGPAVRGTGGLGRAAHAAAGLDVVRARSFNHTGPGQAGSVLKRAT